LPIGLAAIQGAEVSRGWVVSLPKDLHALADELWELAKRIAVHDYDASSELKSLSSKVHAIASELAKRGGA